MIVAHAARVRNLARDLRAPKMKASMMRRSREKRVGFVTPRQNVVAEVQTLETRSLPAGTVTASLSNGNLTIDGDKLDNSILIEVRTTGIFLTGLPDADSDPATFTQIKFDGVTYAAGGKVPLTETPSLKNLTILMRGGNDNVRINVGVVDGDEPAAELTGRLRINLGKGDDNAALVLNNGTLQIAGNLEGDLANGNDSLLVGTAELLSDPDAVIPDTLPITVGGDVIILGRLGDDLIGLAGIDVTRSVILKGDDHNDSLTLTGITLDGNLLLSGDRGDDIVVLEKVTVAGTTKIRGGHGNDQVVITSLNATKNVTVRLDSGDDQLAIGSLTLDATTKLTLDGGAGTDELMSAIELTDPPVKVSFDDTEATIDTQAILETVNDLVTASLDATLPPLI